MTYITGDGKMHGPSKNVKLPVRYDPQEFDSCMKCNAEISYTMAKLYSMQRIQRLILWMTSTTYSV